MLDWLSTYIDQTNEVSEMLERSDNYYIASPDLIAALRERSARVFHLLCSNNDLIRDNLLPLLTPEYALSAEEFDMLAETAQALCTFADVTDACLALHIRKKLLDNAEQRQDAAQIIRQSYECGIAALLLYSAFSLFSMLHVRKHVTPCFAKAGSYLPQLKELAPEARGYVLRSLNNQSLIFNPREYSSVDEQMQILRHALAVYQDPAVRELAPELNWNAFMHAVYQNCLMVTDTIEHGYGLQYLPDIQNAAAKLDTLAEDDDLPFNDMYSQLELRNVLHIITDEECIAALDAIHARRDKNVFTPEESDKNVLAPAYTFVYEERIQHKNPARVNYKIEQIIDYINAYHNATGDHDIGRDAVNLIRNYPHMDGILPFRDMLIRIFRAVHIPTYVHSQMVAGLSRIIAEAMLDACPEYFAEWNDIADAQEVRARRAEILEFIHYAGLLHDVGKFFCMSVITQYARRLFDDEFDIIKMHSVCGYEILKGYDSTAPFAEVALMHHITFDRKGGYAMDFMPEKESSAVMTDIIHIADAIDAATDSVGRCYTQCKTLAQLIDELVTRPKNYNPEVVGIITRPETVALLENMLNEERIAIYKQTYSAM